MTKINRSVFVIREKNTDTFCTSSRFNIFSERTPAALFLRRENAEDTIKDILSDYRWSVENVHYSSKDDEIANAASGSTFLEMDLEVVEFRLVQV